MLNKNGELEQQFQYIFGQFSTNRFKLKYLDKKMQQETNFETWADSIPYDVMREMNEIVNIFFDDVEFNEWTCLC